MPVVSNQQEGKLSPGGIISYTNIERRKIGLQNLGTNNQLTASAQDKLQDMFANQYFEHVSPTGENVSTVAARDGYTYPEACLVLKQSADYLCRDSASQSYAFLYLYMK